MNNPNVGSTGPLPPKDAAAPDASQPRPEWLARIETTTLAEKRNKRRQLLIGGGVASGLFTLASGPVLAQKKKQCTVSAIASNNSSLATPSHCGNSPGCWKKSAFNAWAPGTTFIGQPVNPVHSTTFRNSSNPSFTFPTSGTCHFIITGTGASTSNNGGDTPFGTLIEQNNHCKLSVTLNNGQTFQVLDQGGLSQLVAALLNSFFFGHLYSISGVGSVISTFLNTVISDATGNNTTGITSAAATFASGGQIYQANNNFTESCP